MFADDVISGNARRQPAALGWTFDSHSWSWAEIEDRIAAQAKALKSLGLKCGDRVAVFSENSANLAELYFSLSRAGLVAVPINPRSVRHEIDFLIEDVGARALVCSQKFVNRLGNIDSIVASIDFLIGFTRDACLPYALDELAREQEQTPNDTRNIRHNIRAIKYTSGTTGNPKGCISTHQQFLFNLRHYLIQVPILPDDRALLALPMAAGVGIYLLSTYAYAGIETIIMERARAEEILDAIQDHKITRIYLVPTIISAMVEEQRRRPRNLSSLRLIGYGGQAVAASTIFAAMHAFDCGFYQTFGASEAGGFLTYLSQQDHIEYQDAETQISDEMGRIIMPCGKEVQGFHIRIVGDDRQDVLPNAVGEICVQSDSNMEGYWNRPQQTAEIMQDGWLNTGDIGMRDDAGMIYIVDRKRDMIVTGGLNVYSIEVENVLFAHPSVREAAVVGLPDDYWGERVEAFIAAEGEPAEIEMALRSLCEARLASYKRPKRYRFLEELPKTSSGKIRKVELREMK